MDVQAHVLARAERAADPAEGEAHELVGEPEALGDLVAVVVQPLRRDDEVDAAVVGGDGEAGLGAHERLVLHPDLVRALDDDGPRASGSPRRITRSRNTLPSGWSGGASGAASGSVSGSSTS